MFAQILDLSRRARVFGLVAAIGIPLGLYAYNGGFSTVPAPIDQPIGYVAQDDITNFNLTSNIETIFRPEYNRQYWTGNLHAYPINSAGQINTSVERWNGGAATILATQDWNTGRFIGTMNEGGSGVAFRDTNLCTNSSQSDCFPTPPSISGNTYSRANLLAFLRGDSTNEGGSGMRQRGGLTLGDIVHSRPYFYDDDIDDTVFVGANDGMMHAFDATSGVERWAYVPSMLLGKLKTLAYNPLDSSNVYKHDYFVDGQINIGSISTGSGTVVALVGSLGAGGKGLYALNINSLNAASDNDVASKALWEITPSTIKYGGNMTTTSSSNGYSHLGYTFGTPQIVKMKLGNTPTDVVIIGNGYDQTGYAYLYLINAATGARIGEIRAGTGTPTANSANGIFEPKALDVNGDGYVDRVYAADLNGSLWKFDVSGDSSSSWTATSIFTTNGNLPVTSTLGVMPHPNGGYMVDFGTGATLSGTYGTYNHTSGSWTTPGTGDMTITSPATYYVYGIWDGPLGTVTDSNLIEQTLQERSYSNGGVITRVRRATANAIDWTTKKGWKVLLPSGERVVGEGSFIENGRFYFNSYNPTVVPTLISGTTTDIFGENWLMELNALTGGSSSAPFLDMDGNVLLDKLDRIRYTDADIKPAGASTGDPILTPNEQGIPVGKFISTGVQSQPLLVELQTLNTTLINQNPDVIYPQSTSVDRGVAGGHFDVDYFYPPAGVCSNLSGGTGAKAVGSIKFTYASSSSTATVNSLLITTPNGEVIYSGSPGKIAPKNLDDMLNGVSSASYTLTKNGGGNSSTVQITAINPGAAYNGNLSVAMTVGGRTSTSYTIVNMTGGSNASSPSSSSSTQCSYSKHIHEYDDMYNKTGMNFLNPSSTAYLLSAAIPSASTPFKVLLMNQYLNPAVQIHIGRTDYNPASGVGYVSVRNFQTDSNITVASIPTYTRSNIGSFALNMPLNAFSVFNWWGSSPSDQRVGLMPTSPQCVYYGKVSSSGGNSSTSNADLYNPVIPDFGTPPSGPGNVGSNTGVRHNGAITVQIIKDTTPQDAIELNIASHPEYGYRVKSANFFSYVLAEYSMYWHHPSRVCFGDSNTNWYNGSSGGNGYPTASSGAWNTSDNMEGTGWTKAAKPDTKASTANATPAPNSTDPSIGAFGGIGGNATSVTTSVNGNVTTTRITYTSGSYTIIVTTADSGRTKIETTEYSSTGVASPTSTVTVADARGTTTTGGDERGTSTRTGRISWRELIGN